jgi:hypothetical protein
VVIGSMVPDFGWFLPWRPARFETHSADALVTFCLPVGLAVYWAFQWLLKEPLIELLPPGAYARWRASKSSAPVSSIRQWLLAAAGLLCGAVTHLIWDAFTHEGGRGVRMLPVLEDPSVQIGSRHLAGPHLLQDVNSLLGLMVVIAILAYGLRPGLASDAALPRRLAPSERRAWLGAYLLVAGLLTATFFWRHQALPNLPPMPVSRAGISLLRGTGATLWLVGAVLYVRLRKAPGERSGPGQPVAG